MPECAKGSSSPTEFQKFFSGGGLPDPSLLRTGNRRGIETVEAKRGREARRQSKIYHCTIDRAYSDNWKLVVCTRILVTAI